MEADSGWTAHMRRGDCGQDRSCPRFNIDDSCAVVEKGWVMEQALETYVPRVKSNLLIDPNGLWGTEINGTQGLRRPECPHKPWYT